MRPVKIAGLHTRLTLAAVTAPFQQKRSVRCELLHSIIPAVNDVYIIYTIDCHIVWTSELPVAVPLATEAQQKVAFGIELLNAISLQIANVNIIHGIDSNPERLPEFAIAAAIGTELTCILPISRKNLADTR